MAKRLGGREVTTEQIKGYRRRKGFEYSRKEAVQIWHEVRSGFRKRFPDYFWGNSLHQQYVGQAFLKEYSKQRHKKLPQINDFKKNRLKSILVYNNGSPYQIFRLCGLADPTSEYYREEFVETPWLLLRKVPGGFWLDRENRIKATKWLTEEKLKKTPETLTQDDYYHNGFSGIVKDVDKTIFELIREAYPMLRLEDRGQVSFGYWKDRERVDKKFDEFMKKIGRVPVLSDFHEHRKTGLCNAIQNFHGGIANYKMERGLEGRMPWYYWADKKHRIEAVRSAVETIGKPPREIRIRDLAEHGLGTVVAFHGSSTYQVLKEAGLINEPTEMKKVPRNYWRNKENIDKEFNRLMDLLGHIPTHYELSYHGRGLLDGIVSLYGGLINYKIEKGYTTTKPRGFWKDENNVRIELEKIVENAGIFPTATEIGKINVSLLAAASHYHGGLVKLREKYFSDVPSVVEKKREERLSLEKEKEERRKRFLDMSREEAVQVWHERRLGKRKKFPDGFLQNINHRTYLIQAVVEEFGEGYPTLDFMIENKLGAFINWYYGDSPYLAFIEAGFTDPKNKHYDPELAKTPWLALKQLPKNFFDNKKVRVEAVKWLEENVGGVKNVTADAFEEYGLSGLFQNTYDSSTFKALKEAYPNLTVDDLSRRPAGYGKTRKGRNEEKGSLLPI